MGVPLSKIGQAPRTLRLAVGDDGGLTPLAEDQEAETILHVTFAPGRITPKTEAIYSEAEKTGRGQMAAVVHLVCEIVTEWDLLGEDGNPIPLTDEGLSEAPFEVLVSVLGAVFSDLQPAGKGRSGSSSRRKAG